MFDVSLFAGTLRTGFEWYLPVPQYAEAAYSYLQTYVQNPPQRCSLYFVNLTRQVHSP